MPWGGRHRKQGARPLSRDPRLHQCLLASTADRCATPREYPRRQGRGHAARAWKDQRAAGTRPGGLRPRLRPDPRKTGTGRTGRAWHGRASGGRTAKEFLRETGPLARENPPPGRSLPHRTAYGCSGGGTPSNGHGKACLRCNLALLHLVRHPHRGDGRRPRLVRGWFSPDRRFLGLDDASLARHLHGSVCWVGVATERSEPQSRSPQDPDVLPSRVACRRGTRIGHRVLWRRGGLRPQSLHLAEISIGLLPPRKKTQKLVTAGPLLTSFTFGQRHLFA